MTNQRAEEERTYSDQVKIPPESLRDLILNISTDTHTQRMSIINGRTSYLNFLPDELLEFVPYYVQRKEEPIDPKDLFEAIKFSKSENVTATRKYLVRKGAGNMKYCSSFELIPDFVERKNNPIDPTTILKCIYYRTSEARSSIEYLIKQGADYGNWFPETLLEFVPNFVEREIKPVNPTELLEKILNIGSEPDVTDKARFLIQNGADLDHQTDSTLTLKEVIFSEGLFELLPQDFSPRIELFYSLVDKSFMTLVKGFLRFKATPNLQELQSVCNNFKATPEECNLYKDIVEVARDYVLAIKENLNTTTLSALEISVLRGKLPIETSAYRSLSTSNSAGLSFLHLAILGGNCELILPLAQRGGFDILEKSPRGISGLSLLAHSKCKTNAFLDLVENADEILDDRGSTFIDYMLPVASLERILAKTQDPLLRPIKDPWTAIEMNSKHVNLCFLNGNVLSTTDWGFARAVTKNFANTQAYILNRKSFKAINLHECDLFLSSISTNNNFPKNKEVFTLQDFDYKEDDLLFLGQQGIEFSNAHNVPYMGIDDGAQILALTLGGSLYKIKNYTSPKTTIALKGSLPHFMMLTKEQQKGLLMNCNFPEVIIDTRLCHNFVPQRNDDLFKTCGITTEDGASTIITGKNHLSFGFLFKPQIFYKIGQSNDIQHVVTSNIIHLAFLHNQYRTQNATEPRKIVQAIKERIDQCLENPDTPLLDFDETYQAWFRDEPITITGSCKEHTIHQAGCHP